MLSKAEVARRAAFAAWVAPLSLPQLNQWLKFWIRRAGDAVERADGKAAAKYQWRIGMLVIEMANRKHLVGALPHRNAK